jgi:peptide/nickel transport system permease protein
MCVSFGLIRFIPGDPVALMLGDMATPENVANMRQALGLNGSLPEQFVSYAAHLLQGDLGTSITTRQSVNAIVGRTLSVTLWLIAVTIAMGIPVAIPVAVLAALYRRSWFGAVFRIVTSVSLATPSFFSGLIVILVFAIVMHLAPVAGYQPEFPGNLYYLWLPALVLNSVLVPVLARVLQSSIVDTLDQEFVETAIVRGLPRQIIVWRYVLRPSLAPTVGLLGYIVGQMLGAVVVVEIVFNIPGIGTALLSEGVLARDYPVVQGIVFVFGLIVVVVNFIADVTAGLIDPRMKAT